METNRPRLADALARADRVHDSDALALAIRRVGAEIDRALAGERAIFLTVMQGALVFAGQLATAIATPLAFDYVHATRYRGATSGGALLWIKQPGESDGTCNGGPNAGQWWADYALGLAQRAGIAN